MAWALPFFKIVITEFFFIYLFFLKFCDKFNTWALYAKYVVNAMNYGNLDVE